MPDFDKLLDEALEPTKPKESRVEAEPTEKMLEDLLDDRLARAKRAKRASELALGNGNQATKKSNDFLQNQIANDQNPSQTVQIQDVMDGNPPNSPFANSSTMSSVGSTKNLLDDELLSPSSSATSVFLSVLQEDERKEDLSATPRKFAKFLRQLDVSQDKPTLNLQFELDHTEDFLDKLLQSFEMLNDKHKSYFLKNLKKTQGYQFFWKYLVFLYCFSSRFLMDDLTFFENLFLDIYQKLKTLLLFDEFNNDVSMFDLSTELYDSFLLRLQNDGC
ncbi:hypothetical protein PCE1_002470 [Barthelona sp. PCE]